MRVMYIRIFAVIAFAIISNRGWTADSVGIPLCDDAHFMNWAPEAQKSIALIRVPICKFSPCEGNPPVRLGTGFLYKDSTGEVGVVTAFHVVAGATDNMVDYQFEAAGQQNVSTKVVKIDVDDDLAFLTFKGGAGPATNLTTSEQLPTCPKVWVFGHTLAVAYPIETQGLYRRLPKKVTLQELLLDPAAQNRIKDIGILKLSTEILLFQNILQHGDSGAPIFDDAGHVIAIANGGLPASNGLVSWGIPIEALKKLKPGGAERPQRASTATGDFSYALQVDNVFSPVLADDREIGEPQISFALRFDMRGEPLEGYGNWLKSKGVYADQKPGAGGTFDVAPMDADSTFFPGGGEAVAYANVLEALQRSVIDLNCYDLITMNDIFMGIVPISRARPLASISIKLSRLKYWIRDGRIAFSTNEGPWNQFLNLSTVDPMEIGKGHAYTAFHRNYTRAAELLGGGCRLTLGDHPDIFSGMERSIVGGEALISIRLSELLILDLWNTALLPRGNDLTHFDLWAMAPSSPLRASDDPNETFERH